MASSETRAALNRTPQSVSFAKYGRVYILHDLEYDDPPWIPPGLDLSWAPTGKEWRKLTKEEEAQQDMPFWWEKDFIFPDVSNDSGDSDFGSDEEEAANSASAAHNTQKTPKMKNTLRQTYMRFPKKKRCRK